MNATRLILLLAGLLLPAMTQEARSVTIDWVTVGDPGNANDITGYGAVNYDYRIGKYEVTIQQYADFLNAAAMTDTYSLYNGNMGFDSNIAGISQNGSSGSYTYSVIGPSGITPAGASSPGSRPITFVSWFDAARFANWMHNGQGSGSTETGAYTLNGATSGDAPARSEGAQYYIPTKDEWYKAAYYSPKKNGPGSPGYYTYATQSDSAPGNTIGSGTNQANYRVGGSVYSVTQSSNSSESQNYLTDVGAFTNSSSYYGTFDMSGNVFEWNDLTGIAGVRGIGGGYWNLDASNLSSSSGFTIAPVFEGNGTGFRLASPVPEPATLTINVPIGEVQTQSQAGYPLLAGTVPVVKTGSGTLVLDAANTFSSSIAVSEGTAVAANLQAVGTATVDVSAGAAFAISPAIGAANPVQVSELGEIAGTIDVNTGRFSLPASRASPATELRSLLISGRSGGTWNGAAGIVSSAAAASEGTRVVGYVVAADGSALVAFAASGDTNLDGQVDVFDLVSVNSSAKYGSGEMAVWSQGDFNYDGATNVFDLVGMNTAGAYAQGNYLPVTPGETAVTAIPEPSFYAVAIAALACGGDLGRRRRKRNAG